MTNAIVACHTFDLIHKINWDTLGYNSKNFEDIEL